MPDMMPILSSIVFLPLAAALAIVFFVPKKNEKAICHIATWSSLLVFFVLAMQCLPTLVTSRKETGSWKWPLLQLGWMSTLAWCFAFLTYHGLGLLGVG